MNQGLKVGELYYCDNAYLPVSLDNRGKPEYRFCLVLVESLSSFTFAYPLKNLKASTVADVLERCFLSQNQPRFIYTDFGRELANDQMDRLFQKYNILNISTIPSRSESNGAAEKAVHLLKTTLKRLIISEDSSGQ